MSQSQRWLEIVSRVLPVVSRVPPLARGAVALDLRSLGMLRIGLGCLVITDLILRFQDLTAHYTNAGILPTRLVPDQGLLAAWLSPHLVLSSPVAVGCLFVVTMVLGFCVAAGFKTRWALTLTWLLYSSLHYRNPYLNHAGDKVLIVMLFWGIFLPLDRYFTLFGSRDSKTSSGAVSSFATAGALLQFASIYFMGALRKTGSMWQDGSAVWYTLQIDQYARPWTRDLLEFPVLLKGLTWTTLGIEFVAPLLLFAGIGRLRTLGMGLIMLLHLGFAATLELGLFPFISLTLCLMFWPCHGALLKGNNSHVAASSPVAHWRDRLARALVGLLLAWNLMTLFRYPEDIKAMLPSPIVRGIELIRFDQYWSMFAPNPMVFDGWYQITARSESNQVVNLLNHDSTLPESKPQNVASGFPSDRWKEYLMTLTDLGDPAPLWEQVARFLENRYEQETNTKLLPGTTRIIYTMEKTTPKGEQEPIAEPAWPKVESF